MNWPVFTRKIPRKGHVFIAAIEEDSQLEAVVALEESMEGIEQKHNAEFIDSHRDWHGWVVMIAEDVSPQIQWGDEVALKPFGARWWHNPFRAWNGSYTNAGLYLNPTGGRNLFLDNDHKLLVCRPEEMITYRHRRMSEGATMDKPLYKRLLVKYEDRDAGLIHEGTGLILGGYGVSDVFDRDGFGKVTRDATPNALAQVIDVGFDIDPDDFRVGDWVLCAPSAGTMITKKDGEYGVIESRDVPVSYGAEKPAGRIQWKAYNEELYG